MLEHSGRDRTGLYLLIGAVLLAVILLILRDLIGPDLGVPLLVVALGIGVVGAVHTMLRGRGRASLLVPDDAIGSATGANGHLILFPDRVRLIKSGARAFVGVGYGAGTKDISLNQISAVQWRDAGSMLVGYIAFSFLGGSDPSGGVFDAARSENAVTFTPAQQPSFERLRSQIEAHRPRSQGTTASAQSAADQIRELGSLREAGLISPEEFETKKAELLSRF